VSPSGGDRGTSHDVPDSGRIVDVAFLRRNIDRTFTYKLEIEADVLGTPVVVPLRSSLTVGIVVGYGDEEDVQSELKSVGDVLEDYFTLPRSLISLGHWISQYYVAPINKVFESMLPPRYLPSPSRAWNVIEVPDECSEVPNSLLNIARRNDRVELSDLIRESKLQKSEVTNYMESLRQAGFVEKTLTLERPRVSRRTLNFVKKTGDSPDDENLSRKEKECLEYLARNGDSFQRDLPESLARSNLLSRLADKDLIERTERVVRRNPIPRDQSKPSTSDIQLTSEQNQALTTIRSSLKTEEFETHLLHGVTGSGKTEVYFRLVEDALERDGAALVLVPEITLASFMLHRFRDRFGDNLAVLHSGLSAGERLDEWIRIQTGEASVVLGVQSAVFAPLNNLSVIVVDDSSYKSGQTPRYHARDVAVKLGQMQEIPVVLGSATPSVESYSNARRNRYELMEMTERPLGGELPSVRILDLRNEDSPLNETLIEKTRAVLEDGGKVIWFLNRRGHSNFLLCQSCGDVVECQNCNVSLTYHSEPDRLRCHYCGFARQNIPDRCPNCGDYQVDRVGMGTQHLETVAENTFGVDRIIRMDSDTVTRKKARTERLQAFGKEGASLLIGTQMVTKGLDFEEVNFVGVLNVDTGLNLPDFRSGEYTFQQLVQVCGRAGRKQAGAQVLVQTYNPGHYSVQLGARQSYEEFFRKECSFRKPLNYPPFARLINIVAIDSNEKKVARTLEDLREVLPERDEVELMGPVPCGVDYVKGKHRWHLLARGRFPSQWRVQLRKWTRDVDSEVRVNVDVDPTEVL